MAYLAPIDMSLAVPVGPASKPIKDLAPAFSALEWGVIRDARRDPLWTLRPAGRLRRFVNWLTNRTTNPKLASKRLETLRQVALLTWHYGFTVPGEDVARFLKAGFSIQQYELMVEGIRALSLQLRTAR
ncbi:hypothetical protein H9L12_01225 [Sphingomonas rhizophila]|uniref:Uncharacterized protein n=1 Tax=Sphingomonas rhizophila TaxID=2071607 RepID=A0A7G9SBR5_9SPHN|nr:hypothetical protein [Sphingomonas rhizophila]QNN65290.1 hypothetical protein H9L12_01225 [Sphingomonas rhizophila]